MSRRDKGLILILVVLLMALFIDNILLGPIRVRLDSINASIDVAEKQLSKDRAILARRHLIQTQYKQIVPARTSASGETGDNWLSDIEKAAKGNITIRNITPLPQETSQSHALEKVEVICRGTLDHLTKFVYNVRQKPCHPSVRRMRIKATDDPKRLLDCNLEIGRSVIK